MFQSTLPAGGATALAGGIVAAASFQSTLPAGGATYTIYHFGIRRYCFNPRSPQGERRGGGYREHHAGGVSIHAPRRGSDSIGDSVLSTSTFQSTLPAGGATSVLPRAHSREDVSIHAPRRGSDQIKGAGGAPELSFNPRSPQGERQAQMSKPKSNIIVSIHAPRRGSDQVSDW